MDDSAPGSLEKKLAQLRADFGEDIAVYDFDDDGLQSLGGLDEEINDFNDETFGMDTVGKDFDFSGSTAQYLTQTDSNTLKPSNGSSWTTVPSLLADRNSTGTSEVPQPLAQPSRNEAISLNDDPLLGPISSSAHHRTRARRPTNPHPPVSPQGVKIRSLEEIEQELLANSSKPQSLSSPSQRALTLEEVEAALFANHRDKKTALATGARSLTPFESSQSSLQARAQLAQQVQLQQASSVQRNNIDPLGTSSLFSSIPPTSQTPSALPAITHPAHPTHPQHSEWLRLQKQQLLMYTNLPSQQALIHIPAIPTSHIMANRCLQNPTSSIPSNLRMGPARKSMSPILHTSLPYLHNPSVVVEDLRSAADARIQEHERQEALRRKKAAKIAEMARYNNLMSQGDKDFITRIQVSQLVNPSHGQVGFDPYADDFYFHIYTAIRASRMAVQQQAQAVAADRRLSAIASGQAIPIHDVPARDNRWAERRLTRRDHAMIRMAQNVQRIIDHAKQRPKMSQVTLEGALGKIALRTRSAPRQMLQVQPTSSDNLATAAGGENHPGALSSSLPKMKQSTPGQPAMHRRKILMSLERLYSVILEVEQLRRTQPSLQSASSDEPDQNKLLTNWETQYVAKKDEIWRQLRVLDPLGLSNPHPFVSFLSVAKGKRVLPRVIRLFTREQSLQVLTLLVATFETIDVVKDAPLLDLPSDPRLAGPYPSDKRSRSEIEFETDLFMSCVVAPMMAIINDISLELVTGLVGLLLDRNDLLFIARSRPGIAFLTLFLSRAELLKSVPADMDTLNGFQVPTNEALVSWHSTFERLFYKLGADFPSLFPSTRAVAALPFGKSHLLNLDASDQCSKYIKQGLDVEDEPVWQLMAALAVSTDSDGQQTLVGGLRDKVLENVTAVTKKWVSEEIGTLKIRNVNLMLHALGLDASMINP
ncbi:hypothetical protein O181_016663 [Austropuccinia psidii MF-1]|uniref:mRNA decay factor PAT1 domain-containing protein n=1 Tax=Austropuccinia psidii MF-1 TaxID=1389203 RepID=A0A9Q3GR35_9BASI|nr:hypothetical protein [Austropuccinia psidii MF-1]